MNNQYFYPNFNPGYLRGPVQAASMMPRSVAPIASSSFATPTSILGGASRAPAISSLLGGASRAPAALASTGATAAKSFSWTGLLNGASKTLGVINQAIPVVYQVKPIWNNAKTMFRVVKELNKSDTPSNTSVNSNTDVNSPNTSQTNYSSSSVNDNDNNLPTFFK